MMGKSKIPAGVWWGNVTAREQVGDLGVDGRIILKWMLTK